MKPATIMIVEDERLVSAGLKTHLEAIGHQVAFTTTHGERAVESAVAHRPDVILMDIFLAGDMDGIEAARQIREKVAETIPVIFLSAYSNDDLVERARTVDSCCYLLKPCPVDQLRVAIRMVLPDSGNTAGKGPADRSAGRILVMDDEEMVRGVLNAMLERSGYRTVMTEEGEAAVECYRKSMENGEPFDAVIVDLEVSSGMGGKEAIRRLREIDPAVTAIAHSGSLNDPAMIDHQKYGFAAALPKPCSIRELRGMMARLAPLPEQTPAP